jgi:hypothetical protein
MDRYIVEEVTQIVTDCPLGEALRSTGVDDCSIEFDLSDCTQVLILKGWMIQKTLMRHTFNRW